MPNQPLRFLALGDSYTIGESIPASGRWPLQLVHQLQAKGLPFEAPIIIAQTGWTTAELQAGIAEAKPKGRFDLVSLQIGVNNQYRGRTLDEYRRQFVSLLDLAIAFAGGQPDHVMVLSIPDWSITPFAEGRDRAAIHAAIDRFNAVNRAESLKAQAHYIDITPASRLAAQDEALLAADGLHPAEQMYSAWVQLALPAALVALENESV